MEMFSAALTVVGLCVFETVCSIDNAIINAEVLSTMREKARRWFLLWGMLFAVFMVRGLLPWLIVWVVTPGLGPIDALTVTFSGDMAAQKAIADSSPYLLMGGGVFLVFLFLHWIFLEPKNFGLRGERFMQKQGAWFYAIVSITLAVIVWNALEINKTLGFAAVVGSTVFFITHGFKQFAEEQEKNLMQKGMSDISKIMYLEVIDTTFSIDGVLGAFAFTLSIPLILLGNGLGAVVVRQMTIGNIERIKRYPYLKNGAMYSVAILGVIMVIDGFGYHIPEWVSPSVTICIITYFFMKSRGALRAVTEEIVGA